MHAEHVNVKGATLKKCVGFVDYKEVRTERPGGINENQSHAPLDINLCHA